MLSLTSLVTVLECSPSLVSRYINGLSMLDESELQFVNAEPTARREVGLTLLRWLTDIDPAAAELFNEAMRTHDATIRRTYYLSDVNVEHYVKLFSLHVKVFLSYVERLPVRLLLRWGDRLVHVYQACYFLCLCASNDALLSVITRLESDRFNASSALSICLKHLFINARKAYCQHRRARKFLEINKLARYSDPSWNHEFRGSVSMNGRFIEAHWYVGAENNMFSMVALVYSRLMECFTAYLGDHEPAVWGLFDNDCAALTRVYTSTALTQRYHARVYHRKEFFVLPWYSDVIEPGVFLVHNHEIFKRAGEFAIARVHVASYGMLFNWPVPSDVFMVKDYRMIRLGYSNSGIFLPLNKGFNTISVIPKRLVKCISIHKYKVNVMVTQEYDADDILVMWEALGWLSSDDTMISAKMSAIISTVFITAKSFPIVTDVESYSGMVWDKWMVKEDDERARMKQWNK